MKNTMAGVKARPVEYDNERDYTRFFEKEVYPVLHRMKHDMVNDNPKEMVLFYDRSCNFVLIGLRKKRGERTRIGSLDMLMLLRRS